MPQVEDTTFILSFTAFDAPVIPTAGVHDFSFVIDEDCRFTAIRIKGEAKDYADDEEVEGHNSSTHEQAGSVRIHVVLDADDDCSPLQGEGHSGKYDKPAVDNRTRDLQGILHKSGYSTE